MSKKTREKMMETKPVPDILHSFENNAALGEERWDIKITLQAMTPKQATKMIHYMEAEHPFGATLGDVDVVGTTQDKDGDVTLFHKFLRLDDYIKMERKSLPKGERGNFSRANAIENLLKDRQFLALCMTVDARRVEDFSGNTLEVMETIVPFKPKSKRDRLYIVEPNEPKPSAA